MTSALPELHWLVDWLRAAFAGPFGGVLGGALSFLLLEMGYKRRRARHDIAEALSAEVAHVAEQLDDHIREPDPHEIPPYFRISHVVFDALADRLAELRFHDVLNIAKLYRVVDELNRMPLAWRERADNAYGLPSGHPSKASEIAAVSEGRKAFYDGLAQVRNDCIGLATHLRTRYTLGWRSWIPFGLRPTKRIPRLTSDVEAAT
jgi:hypothetical protein